MDITIGFGPIDLSSILSGVHFLRILNEFGFWYVIADARYHPRSYGILAITADSDSVELGSIPSRIHIFEFWWRIGDRRYQVEGLA